MSDDAVPADDRHHFLVICRFPVDLAGERLDQLRPAHLAYIGEHRHAIEYGGVIGDSPVPQGVCYVLGLPSAAAATEFVRRDPYRDAYVDVTVEPFVQRLGPSPNPGATR